MAFRLQKCVSLSGQTGGWKRSGTGFVNRNLKMKLEINMTLTVKKLGKMKKSRKEKKTQQDSGISVTSPYEDSQESEEKWSKLEDNIRALSNSWDRVINLTQSPNFKDKELEKSNEREEMKSILARMEGPNLRLYEEAKDLDIKGFIPGPSQKFDPEVIPTEKKFEEKSQDELRCVPHDMDMDKMCSSDNDRSQGEEVLEVEPPFQWDTEEWSEFPYQLMDLHIRGLEFDLQVQDLSEIREEVETLAQQNTSDRLEPDSDIELDAQLTELTHVEGFLPSRSQKLDPEVIRTGETVEKSQDEDRYVSLLDDMDMGKMPSSDNDRSQREEGLGVEPPFQWDTEEWSEFPFQLMDLHIRGLEFDLQVQDLSELLEGVETLVQRSETSEDKSSDRLELDSDIELDAQPKELTQPQFYDEESLHQLSSEEDEDIPIMTRKLRELISADEIDGLSSARREMILKAIGYESCEDDDTRSEKSDDEDSNDDESLMNGYYNYESDFDDNLISNSPKSEDELLDLVHQHEHQVSPRGNEVFDVQTIGSLCSEAQPKELTQPQLFHDEESNNLTFHQLSSEEDEEIPVMTRTLREMISDEIDGLSSARREMILKAIGYESCEDDDIRSENSYEESNDDESIINGYYNYESDFDENLISISPRSEDELLDLLHGPEHQVSPRVNEVFDVKILGPVCSETDQSHDITQVNPDSQISPPPHQFQYSEDSDESEVGISGIIWGHTWEEDFTYAQFFINTLIRPEAIMDMDRINSSTIGRFNFESCVSPEIQILSDLILADLVDEDTDPTDQGISGIIFGSTWEDDYKLAHIFIQEMRKCLNSDSDDMAMGIT